MSKPNMYPPPASYPNGDNPWDTEPDFMRFFAYGFLCVALRGPSWSWNGYIVIPPNHPWHGKHYDEVSVNVHGGLTWSAKKLPRTIEDSTIPNDTWVLGFDTAHYCDLSPLLGPLYEGPVYRDKNYVYNELTKLADQAGNALKGDS